MENEKYEIIPRELNILVTEEDKTGHDIEKMSDFYGNYIHQLTTQLAENAESEVVLNIPVAEMGIISEVVNHAKVVMAGKESYLPDFDRLPKDVKEKLEKGVYKIGKSKQVDGNLRAVIVDENNVRVKDVTLKKVQNDPKTIETTRSIVNQIQLQQINAKLSVIQEVQGYQIAHDRDQNLRVPFFNARDYILRAQLSENREEQKQNLSKAVVEITKALNSIYTDIDTSSKWLARLTRFPIGQITPLINKSMHFLIEDVQLATKYVGVQMQVFDYLGDHQGAQLALSGYKRVMQDFTEKKIGSNGQSAAILIHEHYPYDKSNVNLWMQFAEDVHTQLNSIGTNNEKIYLVSVEESEDEKE